MSVDRLRMLVTGASRGIGRAIALRLGADGFAVTVHYRSGAVDAAAAAAEIVAAGGAARTLGFDVADRAATRAALAADLEIHGPYWGVVCNAGIARDGAFPALTDDDWDAVLGTNLDGFFNVVQPLVMPMVRAKRGGRIITLASVSGLIGNRGQVNYSASKAGIIGATKALALELASRGITVNCIAPGLVDTEMIAAADLPRLLEMVPAGRVGRPDEVAALASFLCSDAAGYVTRQTIAVNGGLC